MPILRRDGELDPTDGEAALLVAMSAATIDRRLAGERAKMIVGGRSHTKPGSLLKSQIPHRTRTHTHRGRSGSISLRRCRVNTAPVIGGGKTHVVYPRGSGN